MRSFHNILNFIGQSISDNPEYDVDKYPQTPSVSQNPVNTLAMLVSDDKPGNGNISVQYGDWHYAIKPDDGYPWNREAFRLLCQLFQMTMTDLARQGVPEITISK